MKRILSLAVLSLMVLVLSGCETMGPKEKTGTGTGVLLGSVLGGVVGHQTGHGVEGALIGGATGALGGALIGSGMDDADNPPSRQRYSDSDYISPIQVVEMTEDGVPDDLIIAEIRRTDSYYEITSEVISYMKEKKVSDRVIDYMLRRR
jgi:hypothetical protein